MTPLAFTAPVARSLSSSSSPHDQDSTGRAAEGIGASWKSFAASSGRTVPRQTATGGRPSRSRMGWTSSTTSRRTYGSGTPRSPSLPRTFSRPCHCSVRRSRRELNGSARVCRHLPRHRPPPSGSPRPLVFKGGSNRGRSISVTPFLVANASGKTKLSSFAFRTSFCEWRAPS